MFLKRLTFILLIALALVNGASIRFRRDGEASPEAELTKVEEMTDSVEAPVNETAVESVEQVDSNSTQVEQESTKMVADGNSTQVEEESAKVVADGNSTQVKEESAKVVADGNSTQVEVETAKVVADGNSTHVEQESTKLVAAGNSTEEVVADEVQAVPEPSVELENNEMMEIDEEEINNFIKSDAGAASRLAEAVNQTAILDEMMKSNITEADIKKLETKLKDQAQDSSTTTTSTPSTTTTVPGVHDDDDFVDPFEGNAGSNTGSGRSQVFKAGKTNSSMGPSISFITSVLALIVAFAQ